MRNCLESSCIQEAVAGNSLLIRKQNSVSKLQKTMFFMSKIYNKPIVSIQALNSILFRTDVYLVL